MRCSATEITLFEVHTECVHLVIDSKRQFRLFCKLIRIMAEPQKSLCIFIHFSEEQHIPFYVEVFVNELAKFFDEVVLLSNDRTLTSVPAFSENVLIEFQENKGYDFGRFYNYFKSIEKDNYYRIACVNDSNILVNQLDNVLNWEKISGFDFWGLVDSYEKPWFSTWADNHHIQSHFLVFHKKAIDLLSEYFESVDVDALLNEKNQKTLRRNVINKWEIGLSQFMISNGLKTGCFCDSQEFTQRFNIPLDSNVPHLLPEELLANGYPLLKKKVIFERKKFFRKSPPDWKKLIRNYGNPLWKPDTLIEELIQMKKDQ